MANKYERREPNARLVAPGILDGDAAVALPEWDLDEMKRELKALIKGCPRCWDSGDAVGRYKEIFPGEWEPRVWAVCPKCRLRTEEGEDPKLVASYWNWRPDDMPWRSDDRP